jgi:hypothetical protein
MTSIAYVLYKRLKRDAILQVNLGLFHRIQQEGNTISELLVCSNTYPIIVTSISFSKVKSELAKILARSSSPNIFI